MIQQERFLKIIEYLKENQTATLADIAALNGVSVDTVRRDLEQLEGQGLLKRVRGGAVYHNADLATQTFDIRGVANREAKRELAGLLQNYIVDGQTIALNSGTTNIEVAKFLVENYYRLTILTNNIHVLEVLAEARKFTTIVPGGIIDPEEGAIFGDQCERDILCYNIDTAILAVHAISFEKGITDFRLNQAGIIRAMMQAARQKIFAADHSKFNRIACMNVCGIDEMETVVSDSGFPEELRKPFAQRGVLVVTPSDGAGK